MSVEFGGIGFDPARTNVKEGHLDNGQFVAGGALTHVQISVTVATTEALDTAVYVALYEYTPNGNVYSGYQRTAPVDTITVPASAQPISVACSFVRPLPTTTCGTVAVAITKHSGVPYHAKPTPSDLTDWVDECLDELAWPVIQAGDKPIISVSELYPGLKIGDEWDGSASQSHTLQIATNWIIGAAMSQYSGLLQPLYDAIYPVGAVMLFPATRYQDAQAMATRLSQNITQARGSTTETVLSATWTVGRSDTIAVGAETIYDGGTVTTIYKLTRTA